MMTVVPSCEARYSETAWGANPKRPLIHLIDHSDRGLVMKTICSAGGCDSPVQAHGWCRLHYRRLKAAGDASLPATRVCSIDGCRRPHQARGWCLTHYQRWRATGDVGAAAVKEQHARPAECVVDWCPRPGDGARGFCHPHWKRWRKTGDPGPAEIRERLPASMICWVPDCHRKPKSKGLCGTHYVRWSKHGDPDVVTVSRSLLGRTGAAHPGWRGDEIGYDQAHRRVDALRGKARRHRCLHCAAPAAHWAYDHSDPDALIDGFPYSLKPAHYMPLCRSCHRLFDNVHRLELGA